MVRCKKMNTIAIKLAAQTTLSYSLNSKDKK